MFGNPVLNEKDFDKRRLFDKCDIVTGNTPSRKIDDYYASMAFSGDDFHLLAT